MRLSRDAKWLAITGQSASGADAYPPSRVNLIQGISALTKGGWAAKEFRAFPVAGGPSKSIPLTGYQPSMDPDGRLTYTSYSTREDTWMVRNLPLN